MKICPTCGATYPDNINVCPKDGTKLVVQGASQQQSYVLDQRFKIGSVVEQRPIGAFYDGVDQKLGDRVIVFINNPAVLPDSNLVQRAMQEWQQQAKVKGAQGVRYVGSIPDGRIYAVLEPLPTGMTLATRIAKGVIPLQEAVNYLNQICNILKDAASIGLYHRELGPSNVYLAQDGKVILLNFPMAQILFQGIYGDPWFMSPEQAQGKAPNIQSLVYSAGALFYYMVVGRPPFPDTDYKALLQHHINNNPMPPTSVSSRLPKKLDDIIAKSMSKNPSSRFPSPDIFAQEVLLLIEQKEQTMQPPENNKESLKNKQEPVPLGKPKGKEQSNDTPKRSPRRRKKGGFRETLWFKKGAEVDEDDKEKKEGEISDEYKELDERYKDGSTKLTEEDRAKYSVRTGRTGVFQAVKVEDAKVIEKKRQRAELEMMSKRQQKRIIWVSISIVLAALLTVGGIFFFRKVLYKPYLKAEFLTQLDDVLKSVKTPPKKWIIPSGNPKELLNKSRQALKKGHFVLPKGESAVEYFLGALKSGAKGKEVEKLRVEIINYLLSQNHLLKKSNDLKYLSRVAEAANKLMQNNRVVSAFYNIIAYYKRRQKFKLDTKKPVKDYLRLLPVYPFPKTITKIKRKKLETLLARVERYLKKNKLIEPVDKNAVAYWISYNVSKKQKIAKVKNKRDKRILEKRLKKLSKKEKSIKTSLVNNLEKLGKKYAQEKNWIKLSLVLKSISRVDPTSKFFQESMKKYEKNLPVEKLSDVDAKEFTPPK